MLNNVKQILKRLNRRKPIDLSFNSPLRRCLIFWDLLLLGIGGSVDVALYVVLGNVIRDIAGPAVLISMVVGFPVCFGAGLCYAEFASYIPSSGSDYDYIYTSLGEICGFFDGWSVLVASVIATAALAQGAADLLRSLTDEIIYKNTDAHVSLPDHSLLSSNLNIVALLIIIIVTIITAIGVQGSVRFNDIIVVINLLVVVFTVILGLFHLNFEYWSSWHKFAPYGFSGIIKSLPFTIFFYTGFISVTFSTEEVLNPAQVMPRSIVASIIGIFIVFILVAIVQCLVMPYNELPLASPLADAFGIVSFKASKYIIAVGGFCSCLSSVLTACYANSRLTYVMSRDGLLSKFLSKVNKATLVPQSSVVVTGVLAGVLAVFADLTILVEACSLLILFPYVFLCYAVITLRYKENSPMEDETDSNQESSIPVISAPTEQLEVTESSNGILTRDRSTSDGIPKQDRQLPSDDIIINSKTDSNMKIQNEIVDIPGPGEDSFLFENETNDMNQEVEETPTVWVKATDEVPKIIANAALVDSGSNGQLPIHVITTNINLPLLKVVDGLFADATVKFQVKAALGIFVLSATGLSILVRCSLSYSIDSTLLVILLALFALPILISILVIWKMPYSKLKLPFMMPFFPVLPLACLGGTLFVIVQFSLWAWLLFGANTLFGFIIYFCYGIRHSEVQKVQKCTKPEYDDPVMNTQL